MHSKACKFLILAIVFVLAFYLRVSWISHPDGELYPVGIGPDGPAQLGYDGVRYDWIARNLLDRAGYGYVAHQPDAWRSPGYPFFLFAVYSIFGHDYFAVRIVQAFMGAMICLLIYFICQHLSAELHHRFAVGLVASLMYALSYYEIIMTNILYSEVLTTFFLLISILLYCLALKAKRASFYIWVTLGVLCFWYSVLIRPGNILFSIVLFIYAIRHLTKNPKRLLNVCLIFCAGFLLIVGPWLMRNYGLYKKVFFISTNGGQVFYVGNHPASKGVFIVEDARYGKEQVEELGTLDPAEQNRKHYQYGLEFIKTSPGQYLRLLALKQGFLWGHEQSDKLYYDFLPRIPVPLIKFHTIMALAICGAIFLFKERMLSGLLLIWGYILIHAMALSVFQFYQGPRSRIEMAPMLMILASVGIIQIIVQSRILFDLIKQRGRS